MGGYKHPVDNESSAILAFWRRAYPPAGGLLCSGRRPAQCLQKASIASLKRETPQQRPCFAPANGLTKQYFA